MSCKRARKLMILADSLSKEEQVELERHLQECEICKFEWLKWQRLFGLLSQLPNLSSTVEERNELMTALQSFQVAPELDCKVAKSQIWRWLDGDLSKDEVSILVVHLANCDHCQSALWQAGQTVQLLRSLPRLKANAVEKEILKARLRRMKKRSTVVPFLWRVALPVAAAASILLLFALSLLRIPQVDNRANIVHSVSTQPVPAIKPQPIKPIVPKVAEETQVPRHVATLTQKSEVKIAVSPKQKSQLVKPQQPNLAVRAEEPVGEETLVAVQISKPKAKFEAPKPKPVVSEPKTIVTKATEPETGAAVKTSKPETHVAVKTPDSETRIAIKTPEPETRKLPNISVPSEPVSVPTKIEPSIAAAEIQKFQVPVIAQPDAQTRQLIALPPVTIDAEMPIEPPRIKLTVIPPSQRLYQQSGVALVTVPPEKRPIKPSEEKALIPDLSIPLAAERYRSHTASIPLLSFGFSW